MYLPPLLVRGPYSVIGNVGFEGYVSLDIPTPYNEGSLSQIFDVSNGSLSGSNIE